MGTQVRARPAQLEELARGNGTMLGAILVAAVRALDATQRAAVGAGFQIADVATAVRLVAARFDRVDGEAWSAAVRFRRADAVHHLPRIRTDLPRGSDAETRLHDVLVWRRADIDTDLIDGGDLLGPRHHEHQIILDAFGCELGFIEAVAAGESASDCGKAAAVDDFPIFREVAEVMEQVQSVVDVLEVVVGTVPGVTCIHPDSVAGERVLTCTLDAIGIGATTRLARLGVDLITLANSVNAARRALDDAAERRRRRHEDERDHQQATVSRS